MNTHSEHLLSYYIEDYKDGLEKISNVNLKLLETIAKDSAQAKTSAAGPAYKTPSNPKIAGSKIQHWY